MKALLYYDFFTQALTDGTSEWTPPTQTFGETMALSFRWKNSAGGSNGEVFPEIQYAKAAIGNVDASPTSGKFRLKIGDAPQTDANTTAPLDYNVGAQALQDAINALVAVTNQFGTAAVQTLQGSYLLRFGTGLALVPLELVESELHPPCFGRVNAWQAAAKWIAELRLIQAPAAFSDTTSRVLPDAPSITRIQGGYSEDEFDVNEIQQLEMPPLFRGSYQFRRNNVRTALLSPADAAEQIAAALSIYGSTITVTNPRDGIARIEFGGPDFKGTAQPLLEIVVADAPVGDFTLALELDQPPLAAILRTRESISLPLEIQIGVTDASATDGIRVEKIRTEVTIRRGLVYDMLATAAGINWLRPVAKDYVPFTADQIIVGQQFYACALGDGDAVEFTVDHNLNTETIAAVLLRENAGDGRVLVLGTDYSVAYEGVNSLTVTLLGTGPAPATAALALVITGAGPIAAFQAHTHTMAQIIGLATVLEAIGQRLGILENYLPTNPPTLAVSGKTLTVDIPSREEVLFYAGAKPDLAALPVRAPYLLPAVHAATSEALPSPLPAPAASSLWSAAARTLIPGTGRIDSSYVLSGGYVASDGRMLYPATRDGATVSFYPASFERTLWEFPINDAQLQVGRTLNAEFSLAAQLVNATSEAQWVLRVEWGTPIDQTDPANEGLNLDTINWAATPILAQRIYLTPLLMTHSFGVRIRRTADGLTADQLRYGGWQTAGSAAPTTANFVLRARLIQFDTKNNVPDATGWLYYGFGSVDSIKSNATATIS